MITGRPPERQSLMLSDLSTPISSHRRSAGMASARKLSTPGESFVSPSDLPPPPVFTLDDRPIFSPDLSLLRHSSPPHRGVASPLPFSASSPASAHAAEQLSPGRRTPALREEERGKGGSPTAVAAVVPANTTLLTLPPLPMEVARPDIKRNGFPDIGLTQQWVTVYGFPLGDTNLILREFEKCGFILKCIPGPRDANWMDILYENHYDAQKAIRKHGTQINSLLIIGVKPLDPVQGRYLDGKFSPVSSDGPLLSPSPLQNMAGMALPGPCRSGFIQGPHHSIPNYNAAGGSARHQLSPEIASPKPMSIVSRVLHLMFGTS